MSAQMSLSISNPVQDVVLDAEDEVMKMLECALGPMTALLDKKIKQKMSQHALMQIIKGVINLTLRTVDAATPENEKRVLAALEESGISGKKEKRAGKLSGYTLFTKKMHQDKKEEFKSRGLKGGDVTKEIGSMWKKLTDEEKQKYNEDAKKENDENPSSSRKSSKKSSRKGSSKDDKESHKCCFVISKGERKGEMCGTTVRSDEPTFEGQWLCSKHATAEKKKSESNKNKKDKGSKKDKKQKDEEEEKSSKKVKKQAKKDEDEEEKPIKKAKKQEKKDEDEEEKPIKKAKKQEKKDEDEEEKPIKKAKKQEKKDEDEEKPIKKAKKVEKKVEEEEIEEIEDLDEEVLDEEEENYQVLDDMYISWEEDTENGVVNGEMTKKSLEKLTGKKLSGEKYDVILSATKSSLIVKYEEDDEEEMKSIKMDKMNDDLKKVHTYISSLE